MKILVTGSAGFMASHLVDALLDEGHDVVGVDDLSGGSLRNLEEAQKRRKGKFTFVRGNLQDPVVCNHVVQGCNVVYHLAAYAAEGQSVFSPCAINDINVRPMNNLLVASVNNDVKRFVFTSSMAVYGHQIPPFSERMPREPVDPYGIGKTYCESMLESFSNLHGLDYTIIRPHNVFGERQNTADPFRNVIGIWMNMMLLGKRPYIYGDGRQTRAFSYIRNITPCMVEAMKCKSGEIINLGGEEERTINDVYKVVKVAMNSNLDALNTTDRLGEVKHAYCTNDKARGILGYRDTWSLEAGIMKMAEWIRELGPQKPSYRIPLEIEKNAPITWRNRLI